MVIGTGLEWSVLWDLEKAETAAEVCFFFLHGVWVLWQCSIKEGFYKWAHCIAWHQAILFYFVCFMNEKNCTTGTLASGITLLSRIFLNYLKFGMVSNVEYL